MLLLLPTAHGPVTRQGYPTGVRSPPKARALQAPKTVRNRERSSSNPSADRAEWQNPTCDLPAGLKP